MPPTPVSTDYSYDNLGRITDIDAGSSIVKFGYTYVANSNNIEKIKFRHRPLDGASNPVYNNYDYDDLYRLDDVAYQVNDYSSTNAGTEDFDMDDLGNRDGTQVLRGGSFDYVVDDVTNRYTQIDTVTDINYDDAGNLTTDKDGYSYEYDYENRISRIFDDNDRDGVFDAGDTYIVEYTYDALGRRIRKIDYFPEPDAVTLYYYSDKWQVLQEFSDSGPTQKTFFYGNYIDEVLYMVNNVTGSSCLYIHNHLYSPTALMTLTGTVTERIEYDAYGKATRLNSDFMAFTGTEIGNPYYFTGRRLEVLDDGNYDIMYYRNRFYDTETGRFLQQDPLGYVDGLNLYEYASSNSLRYLDPFGTDSLDNLQKYKILADGFQTVNNTITSSAEFDDMNECWQRIYRAIRYAAYLKKQEVGVHLTKAGVSLSQLTSKTSSIISKANSIASNMNSAYTNLSDFQDDVAALGFDLNGVAELTGSVSEKLKIANRIASAATVAADAIAGFGTAGDSESNMLVNIGNLTSAISEYIPVPGAKDIIDYYGKVTTAVGKGIGGLQKKSSYRNLRAIELVQEVSPVKGGWFGERWAWQVLKDNKKYQQIYWVSKACKCESGVSF
ncbi:MAG: RHS repeat-associated core domain-containing protein [Phycisphaerae bacterium]|nr:RHS repeat-associated core domain-containing protein [Phycisphaerae bacterium]